MTNRFRQGLLNKLNIKEEKLKKEAENTEEEITFEKLEEAEELRSKLEEKPTLKENEFEELERRIDNL